MTKEQIESLLGSNVCEIVGIESLVDASNNDAEEGAEWLPRYKLALSLLANACGAYHGVISRLLFSQQEGPLKESLKKVCEEFNVIWEAHLKCLAD